MRVWIAAILVAAASMSGCRRDNPAWLRATEVGTDSFGGSDSGSSGDSGSSNLVNWQQLLFLPKSARQNDK